MKRIIYIFIQFTWGFIQSLAGLIYLIKYGRGKEHFFFHGAYVTRLERGGGTSLGMFIFIGDKLMNSGEKNAYLTHEYGHTIQSLITGPLYFFIIGIPSIKWANSYTKEKLEAGISYFSVFPENQANVLGTKVTKIEVPEHIPMSLFED